MKTRPAIILLTLAVALLRCGGDGAERTAAPPRRPESLHVKGPDDSDDRNNLLNLAHGAVVISRTGEVSLQNSAQCAIDGDPSTLWISPPGEPDQSLTFALPARTQVRSVGLAIGPKPDVFPKVAELESSMDGKHFAPVASLTVPADGRRIVDVKPVEARYMRLNMRGGNQFTRAISVYARGDVIEPVRPGSLDGCWSINGLNASFTQRGASVTGAMAGRSTITIDGGSDGRFYRLLWLRGPEYGIAAVAVTPDGQHLSGVFWHEESYPPFLSATWFGERRPCGNDPKAELDVLAASMQRYGRYAMYGLQFDDAGHLIEEPSRPMLDRLAAYLEATPGTRIVAHELLQSDNARNQSVSQSKVDSLRSAIAARGIDLKNVEFVAVGSDQPHRPASTDAARSIYGAVELERK